MKFILLLASSLTLSPCCKYEAEVLRCYDADTCTLRIDLGLGVEITERVRFSGIDAWELRGEERERGLVARDWLRELIVGRRVRIVTENNERGKYGRLIAEPFLNGKSVSDLLVEHGHATYHDY